MKIRTLLFGPLVILSLQLYAQHTLSFKTQGYIATTLKYGIEMNISFSYEDDIDLDISKNGKRAEVIKRRNLDTILVKRNKGSDYRYIYKYDETGLHVSNLIQIQEKNSWENYTLESHLYDNNKNLLMCLTQVWDDNVFINERQITYIYDTQGNILTRLIHEWDEDKNDWESKNKYVYNYDKNNNCISALRQTWEDDTLKDVIQFIFTYDNNNNLLTKTIKRDNYEDIHDENTYDKYGNVLFH